MRILIVGTFDNYWSTNIEMARSFRNIGHEVIIFDYRKYQKSPKFFMKIIDKIFSNLRRYRIIGFISYKIYTRILKRIKIANFLKKKIHDENPDLIWLCKTDTLAVDKLKKYQNKIVYYFMDPVVKANKIRTDIISSFCQYSISTFGYVHKNHMKSTFNRHNIQGVNKSRFYKFNDWDKRLNRIIFVSNISHKRYEFVKQIKSLGIPIDCYGLGWENKAIYGTELNETYNKYKYALNICQDEFGFSVRVQQSLCAGCILFSETCNDLEEMNFLSKNLILYINLNDFLKKWNHRPILRKQDNLDYLTWESILKSDLDWIKNYQINSVEK